MDQLAILATELVDSSDFEVEGVPNLTENDVSDEEIEPEDLARRMWKDRVRLRRIKERQQKLALQQAELEKSRPKQISDQALRKKMSRAQDGILKYMLKLMEVCNARCLCTGSSLTRGSLSAVLQIISELGGRRRSSLKRTGLQRLRSMNLRTWFLLMRRAVGLRTSTA